MRTNNGGGWWVKYRNIVLCFARREMSRKFVARNEWNFIYRIAKQNDDCSDDDINNIALLVLPSKCSVEDKIRRLVKINFQLTFGICRATRLKIGYFDLTGRRVEYEFRSLAIGLSINLAATHKNHHIYL